MVKVAALNIVLYLQTMSTTLARPVLYLSESHGWIWFESTQGLPSEIKGFLGDFPVRFRPVLISKIR